MLQLITFPYVNIFRVKTAWGFKLKEKKSKGDNFFFLFFITWSLTIKTITHTHTHTHTHTDTHTHTHTQKPVKEKTDIIINVVQIFEEVISATNINLTEKHQYL